MTLKPWPSEHCLANTAGCQLLSPPQLPPQGRQAGEHLDHQGTDRAYYTWYLHWLNIALIYLFYLPMISLSNIWYCLIQYLDIPMISLTYLWCYRTEWSNSVTSGLPVWSVPGRTTLTTWPLAGTEPRSFSSATLSTGLLWMSGL